MVSDTELMEGYAAPHADASSNLGTILIVEDDPRMQKVLRRMFSEEHYTVFVAGDGQTALDLFRKERPLAVVLDLILPRISGRELCQMFKSISNQTPIVVLSAIFTPRDFCLQRVVGDGLTG